MWRCGLDSTGFGPNEHQYTMSRDSMLRNVQEGKMKSVTCVRTGTHFWTINRVATCWQWGHIPHEGQSEQRGYCSMWRRGNPHVSVEYEHYSDLPQRMDWPKGAFVWHMKDQGYPPPQPWTLDELRARIATAIATVTMAQGTHCLHYPRNTT
jgi:hypothetical protein